MPEPTENTPISNIPITGELEDDNIARIDNIAALCAFQSLIIAEGLQVPSHHYGNYCLIIEDQVLSLREALSALFEN